MENRFPEHSIFGTDIIEEANFHEPNFTYSSEYLGFVSSRIIKSSFVASGFCFEESINYDMEVET